MKMKDTIINLELTPGDAVLPCPFCGSVSELTLNNTHTASYWVACACGAELHGKAYAGRSLAAHLSAKASALARWNHRVCVDPVLDRSLR